MENTNKLDKLDMDLIHELINDSSVSIPILSKKIGVNTSVLYSRINRLVTNNIIEKFTVHINHKKLGFSIKSFVGINIETKLKEITCKQLMNISEIISISEIAGRFDVIIIIYAKTLQELYTITNKLNKIDGIINIEIFIELRNLQDDQLH